MNAIDKKIGTLCNGCSTCLNVCPTSAITMQRDEYGVLRPETDSVKCVDCRLCEVKCPVLGADKSVIAKCYAVMAEDDIRFKSSSGGAFYVIAKSVIEKGGIVFGAAWTDDFYVKHTYARTLEELGPLLKSKYAQSEIGNTYQQVKGFLNEGKTVLFVGTPCQAAGLDSFLENVNRSNLILVDFFCYCTPPAEYLRKYLNEKYGLDNIERFSFRDKTSAWGNSKAIYIKLKDGTEIHEPGQTSYFDGYYKALFAREACLNCKFSGGDHRSDLTLGDFWGIEKHDISLNDNKGTSMVVGRTKKGQKFFEALKSGFQAFKSVPMDWIAEHQHNCRYVNPSKERFEDLLQYKPFDVAVQQALNKTYDVGLVCIQSYQNYGSAFTNYALYCVLRDLKKSVLFISQPLCSEIKPSNDGHFAVDPYKPYQFAPFYNNQEEMRSLNSICSMFMVGSDQVFNYEVYKKIDGYVKLNWVDDDHRKMCYSTSFGLDRVLGSEEEKGKFKESLSRFDHISVREASGAKLLKEVFGLDSVHTLDPVFLCDKSHYLRLCTDIVVPSRGIFAYILDPTPEKATAVKKYASFSKMGVSAAADRWMSDGHIKTLWDIPTLITLKNEVWMQLILQNDFIITDSFHGMCFSIIFEKQFVVINNRKRGATRFASLFNMLGLSDHYFDSAEDFAEKIGEIDDIDYTRVNSILAKERENSVKWLMEAMNG